MGSYSLSFRFLSERKGRTLLALGAVAIGVAVFMSQIILGAGQNFIRLWPPESYGPGNITVFTNGEGSQENLARIRGHRYAGNASGELSAYTYFADDRLGIMGGSESGFLEYIGVEFKSAFVRKGYPLLRGRYPRRAREAALSAKFAEHSGITIGGTLLLPLPSGAKNHRIVGLFNDTEVIDTRAPRLALMPYASLSADFHRGDFDRFQVQAKAGKERELIKFIRKSLGPAATIKLKPKGPVVKRIDGGNSRFITGGAVLFVACLLIYNSFLISLHQRKRQLGVFRAVGAGRRQMRRLILGEGLLLGSAASFIGVIVGLGIAALFMWLKNPLIGDADVFTLPLWGPPVSFLLGLGMTLVSVVPASMRAAKTKPLDAIYPERQTMVGWLERRGHYVGTPLAVLGLSGVFYLGLTGDSTPIGVPAGAVGIFLFLLGLVLTSAKLVPPLILVAGRISKTFFGGLGRLAIFAAAKNPGRTGITISTFFIAVTVILGFLTIDGSIMAGLAQTQAMGYGDEIEVDSGLARDIGARLKTVKGIKTIAAKDSASLRLKEYDYKRLSPSFTQQTPEIRAKVVPPTLGLEGADLNYLKIRPIKLESGEWLTMSMLRGGNLFLTRDILRDYGLKIGERIELIRAPLAADPYDLRAIAALYKKAKREKPVIKLKIAGVLGARVGIWTTGVVDRDVFRQLGPRASGAWLISVKEISAKESVARAIDEKLKDHPEASVSTKERVEANYSAGSEPMLSSILGFVGLVMLIGIMSVANTQSANMIEREKEFGLLRAVGLTKQKLKRMILLESAGLGILGSLPGVLAAVLLSYVFITGFRGQAGSALFLPYRFPYGPAVLIVAATALAGLMAGYLATRKATEATIKDALRYE